MAQPPVMDIDLDQVAAQCSQALAGDKPAGDNVRYDPTYDAVKVEIDKLTAMAAGEEGVDWEKVVNGCIELLTKKTKDLNLAAFLALGLFKVKAYAGLAAGLDIILGLMDNIWDQAFPPLKRMKARANVFAWLEERVGEAVADSQPDGEQAPAVRRCRELADRLAKETADKVTVPVTGMSGLRRALAAWVDDLPEPEPEPPDADQDQTPDADQTEAPAQAESPPAPRTKKAPAPAAPAPTAPKHLDSLDQGLELARRVIDMLRALDPTGPLTYRLARVIKWEVVEEAPPAGGDGRTMIPGPRAEDVDSLNAMAKAANWKDLAEEAESQFLAGGAFFLDLQRHAAQALEAQGAHRAAQAVADECARLLGRLPGIEHMSFADGRAFADPATRQWLETIQPRGGQADQASPPETESDDWRREALDLAGAGDLQGGLRRMQEAVRSAPGRKQALERRLAAAELCLDYGKPTWGVPILEDLDRQLHETKLTDWAPEIFARVWAGLIKGYRAGDDGTGLDNQTRAKLEDAKRKLFETDMALAARLSQSDDS